MLLRQAAENALAKNMTCILSNTRILKESKRLAFFGAGQALENCILNGTNENMRRRHRLKKLMTLL